jgi:hypothetical protein
MLLEIRSNKHYAALDKLLYKKHDASKEAGFNKKYCAPVRNIFHRII